MPPPSNLALGVLAACVVAATVIDLRTRRIPNVLTASMTGVGIAMGLTGLGNISVGMAIGGFVVGLLLMLPGYMLGATGAGDVKLMAAIGTLLGPALVVSAFLFTAVAGGVLAIVVAAQRGRVGATLAGTGRLIATPGGARDQIRDASAARRFAYGPAIAIGSVLAAFIG